MSETKTIINFDMDGVLVDFQSGIDALVLTAEEHRRHQENHDYDEINGIFALMKPIPGAVCGIKHLAKHYDVRILTTAPWDNPSAWSDKLLWVKEHFKGLVTPDNKNVEGNPFYKKITITHNKDKVLGDVLVEDNLSKNGSWAFSGDKIWFRQQHNTAASCPKSLLDSGTKVVSNWYELLDVLMPADDTSWRLDESNLKAPG